MIVLFTEEEEEWLVRDPFNWHPHQDAPSQVAESIKAKLRAVQKADDVKNYDSAEIASGIYDTDTLKTLFAVYGNKRLLKIATGIAKK